MDLRNKTGYVMVPIFIYRSPAYARRLKLLETLLPDSRLLRPDKMFNSDEEWLEEIDNIILKVDFGVLVSDNSLIVGAGCFLECCSFYAISKPVFYLNHINRVLTQDFEFTRLPKYDRRFYAKVEINKERAIAK
ncbi:MAG: hypothetical protein M0Z41_16025 [Peptococcaceae bacterium]|jgi:hypothetical protein|nr:hypothetical protein [Peptococcaceae bacterium]